MTQIIQIRRTYKYRLYECQRKDKTLHQMINVAGLIWNHCLALRQRFYRRFGKGISEARLKKHISKLRMRTEKYAFWKVLGSQAVQGIIERQEMAFERFFLKQGGFPQFKNVKKYKSFTLKKTAGWQLLPDLKPVSDSQKKRGVGQIKIGKLLYKFVKHRELKGEIKTLTIKRDNCGRLWLCFSVDEEMVIPEPVSTSRIGGFDFGLKTFLVEHTGEPHHAPEYFLLNLKKFRRLCKAISRKVKGSKNHKAAKWHLCRQHIRIADKRRDFHFKKAYELCERYDVLVFEDLNLAAMKLLWGRKISDLGFAQFLKIIEWVAFKQGKTVLKLERFSPTTQLCSDCGHRQKLSLKERVFHCEACGMQKDRDHNAAINIQQAGASAYTKRDLCKTSS